MQPNPGQVWNATKPKSLGYLSQGTGTCHIPAGGGRSGKESALYTVRSDSHVPPAFTQCGPWQSCVLWLPLLAVTAGFIFLSISILSSFHTMGSVLLKLHFTLAYTLARPASLALFTF